jgi:hypothetical protein
LRICPRSESIGASRIISLIGFQDNVVRVDDYTDGCAVQRNPVELGFAAAAGFYSVGSGDAH